MRRPYDPGSRREALGALAGLLLFTACGDAPPVVVAPTDGGADAGVVAPRDGGVVLDDRFRNVLASAADFAAVTSTTVASVKYLANLADGPNEPPLTADCYFQNMRRFEWHLAFLHSFDELAGLGFDAYVDLVLRRDTRRWWGGAIAMWPGVAHPTSATLGVMSYAVYADDSGLEVDDVAEVDATLKRCAPFAEDLLVFVPEGPRQKAFAQQRRALLEARGVAVLMPEQLVDGLSHVAYSRGEGYGTLRVVPPGERLDDYGPRDIVVVESAPNDISVVQGLITKDPQNALSHTNLRLIEKAVPSVTVPRIYETASIAQLADQLVHVVVTDDRFVLEPARREDAEAHWAATRPNVPAPRADLTVSALADFDTIDSDAAEAYGAKAANIAELGAVLPADNRPAGFAIPFSRYVEHVEANGIDVEIEAFLADPRSTTDAVFKRSELKRIRDLVEDAPFDEVLLAEIEAKIPTSERMRFRSSTNVEDLDALTGAGLYESKTGCIADDRDGDELGPSRCVSVDERAAKQAELDARRAELAEFPERTYLDAIIRDLEGDLTKERTVARAVKNVWSSLWNVRAFDERAYYGIDHRAAFMGIAVHPSFVLEQKSAVAITELSVDAGAPLYRLSTQVGSESVVRPDDPTAIAESLTFRREADAVQDVRVQVRSTLVPPGEDVWTSAELDRVAALLFAVHDHFARDVYAHLAPISFDIELKHTRDGHIVIKQVRPFVTTGP